jgi:phosphate-selective porin OprO and OprP
MELTGRPEVQRKEKTMRYGWSLISIAILGLLPLSLQAAPPDSTASSLQERLEALDQKVRILERLRELEQENAAAKVKETPLVGADKDGFTLKSADGGFRLKIGGYVQSDGRFWFGDTLKTMTNTFVLRRVRPIFEGTVNKYFDFRIMPDFGEGKAALQDAYMNLNLRPGFKVQAGKFKPPVGLERLQSGASLLFVERGMPTGMVPNRDLGIQVHGELANGTVGYAAGVFNGVTDGSSGDLDNNDGKDLAARLFLLPFRQSDARALQNLGLGLAGTLGNQEGALPSFKTPGQANFFTYADTVVADGRRSRLSPQAYYYGGSLGLLGEYALSAQKVARKGATARLRNQSWQVAASYVLTGEQPNYKGVSPKRPFAPDKGQWGAFEIAARYHRLEIDRDAFPLFANPQKAARSASAWAAGINWHLNKNAKINLDYEQTRFAGGAKGGDRKDEKLFMNRFQIAY